MQLFSKIRKVYYFGYGANREPEMVYAITGRRPKVIGTAVLDGYRLGVQTLRQIPSAGANPRRIVHRAWGSAFRSYTIEADPESDVAGTLFKISLHDRHLLDTWELVAEGWYDKQDITVTLKKSGKAYHAETQVMGREQRPSYVVNGLNYHPWLQPKHRFLRLALAVRLQAS
jgi:hypothetical protein